MQTKSMASPSVLYPKSVPEQYWQLLSNQAAFTLRAAAACRNRQPPRASSPLGRQADTLHVQWRGAKVCWIVNPILCYFDFPGRAQFLSSKNQAYATAWNLWCRIIIDRSKNYNYKSRTCQYAEDLQLALGLVLGPIHWFGLLLLAIGANLPL